MKSILTCPSLEAQLLYCIKSEYNICFIHKELFSNILMYCWYLSPALLPYAIQAVSQPSRRCNQGRLFAPTTGCFLPYPKVKCGSTRWYHIAARMPTKVQQKQTGLLCGKEELISCLFSICLSLRVTSMLPGSISNHSALISQVGNSQ